MDNLHDRVESDLSYHRLESQDSVAAHNMGHIRGAAKQLAHMIVENVPWGREQSLALTKIEEASMWAIAGIARNMEK